MGWADGAARTGALPGRLRSSTLPSGQRAETAPRLGSHQCDPNHMRAALLATYSECMHAAGPAAHEALVPCPEAACTQPAIDFLRSASSMELSMQGPDGPPLIHSNRYSASSACGHCDGVIRHEPWCRMQNTRVRYAYQLIADSALLSVEDFLILHALGTAWTA